MKEKFEYKYLQFYLWCIAVLVGYLNNNNDKYNTTIYCFNIHTHYLYP